MSSLRPTEKRFEEHIEDHLKTIGYFSYDFKDYDKDLCLIKKDVISFIKKTQPKEWNKVEKIHGLDTEDKILKRISNEISNRGIIDVLRKGVDERGIAIKLCYFEPNSSLNSDHKDLFESNQFTLIRQLYFSKENNESIDIVLFLNGLAIITIELKNQLSGQNIEHAQKQYRERDPKEPLLKFNRCIAHFCVDNDKVSMTSKLDGNETSFLPYNRDLENPKVDNDYRIKYLWEDILTKSSILDIIENFLYTNKERTRMVFPRYHQLDLIRSLKQQLKKDGVGKSYLIQHTTGAGKSYSIAWLCFMLVSLHKSKYDTKRLFDTILVVTDRVVLDDQLKETISKFSNDLSLVKPAENSKELKEYLEKGKTIVITTIQKFGFIADKIKSLGHKNFAVIIDEVHSSQSGQMSKDRNKSLSKNMSKDLPKNMSEDNDDLDEDYEDYENLLLEEIKKQGKPKNISFFGFTGTPKKETLELFGTKTNDGKFKPYHVYSMKQSIGEGFTLDVLSNYITFERYFKIKQESDTKDTKVQKDQAKKDIMDYVSSHKKNIKQTVEYILDHWINIGSKEIQGKSRGMIVTKSRKQSVWYFNEINKQLKEREIPYRCLVGFSGDVFIDFEKYSEESCNESVGCKSEVPVGLKDDKYRLLVVAKKFQTGFDEPLLQSMYIDRNLKGIQCVQTLSRLNRTIEGKTRTFVLDFENKTQDIKEAFQEFFQATFLEGETDPNIVSDIKRRICDFNLFTDIDVNRFCKAFYDKNRDDGSLHAVLDRVVDKFEEIKDEEDKRKFKSNVYSYIQKYDFITLITSFYTTEFEKLHIFLCHLLNKLPKNDTDRFDISNIYLDSLRIQKTSEITSYKDLVDEDFTIKNENILSAGGVVPKFALESEIINELNNKYGKEFNQEEIEKASKVFYAFSKDEDNINTFNSDNTKRNKLLQIKENTNKRINKLFTKNQGDELITRIISDGDFMEKMYETIYKIIENDNVYKTNKANQRFTNDNVLYG